MKLVYGNLTKKLRKEKEKCHVNLELKHCVLCILQQCAAKSQTQQTLGAKNKRLGAH